MIKIWLDDVRQPPNGFQWFRDSRTLIRWLEKNLRNAGLFISFDHDLGGDDTGCRVANFLERRAFEGVPFSINWTIHSANPVGRERLVSTLMSMERFLEGA